MAFDIDLILPLLIIVFVWLAFTTFRDLATNWRGLWRLLGAICVGGILGVPLNIGLGMAIDPTSHNLAPFELIIWCGGFGIAFFMISTFRRIAVASGSGSGSGTCHNWLFRIEEPEEQSSQNARDESNN